MWKKIEAFLTKIEPPKWVIILLAVILVLRIPSFFEPYYYGDEMIYLTLGQGIRHGIALYGGIFDNKPPLLYLTAALAGNLYWFKAILAIWNLGTILVFWKLASALFPANSKLVKISSWIFGILTTIPLLEGNIVNAELFMIGPTILSFYILWTKKHNFTNIFLAGILIGIAGLFKIPSVFDAPVIVIFWLLTMKPNFRNLKVISLRTLYLVLGFSIPFLITFVIFYLQGVLKDYISAAFLQNVGYLSSFRPGDVQKPFLVRNLPLLIRGAIVLVGIFILFLRRKHLSKQFIFLTIWLMCGLFAVTLSERPYPHYLIQVVPELSLLIAFIFALENIEQTLVIIPICLAFAVPVIYKFGYYSTAPYYWRFIKFATGQMTKEQYLANFSKEVPLTYKIASFITVSAKPTDQIFVTGDSPAVYALTRRLPPGKFVADYHINDYSSGKAEAKLLSAALPHFIIVRPEKPAFPELTPVLKQSYILIAEIDGAQIWKTR